jgi:Flp pilus assembly protein TadG
VAGRSEHSRDSGTAVFLIPAGMLIMLLLASIAVDFSQSMRAHRDLQRIADAVANDVVTRGLDTDRIEREGTLKLLPATELQLLAERVVAAQVEPGFHIDRVEIADATPPGSSEPQVVVRLHATTAYVFARFLAPIGHGTALAVTSHATARITG